MFTLQLKLKKKLVLKWTWDQLFRLSLGKKTKKNNFTWHGWQKAKGMTIFWAVIHFHHHHHRLWSKSLVMFSNSWSHELEIWLHKASQSWLLGETDVWILKEDSMPKSANPLSIIIIQKLEKKSNIGKRLTRERYNTWKCSSVLQYFMFSGTPTETCCFQPDDSIVIRRLLKEKSKLTQHSFR